MLHCAVSWPALLAKGGAKNARLVPDHQDAAPIHDPQETSIATCTVCKGNGVIIIKEDGQKDSTGNEYRQCWNCKGKGIK